jgi:hypothetical protein
MCSLLAYSEIQCVAYVVYIWTHVWQRWKPSLPICGKMFQHWINAENFPVAQLCVNTLLATKVTLITDGIYFGRLRVKQAYNYMNYYYYYHNHHHLGHCSPARAMASSFTRFLDHTKRRAIFGRTPLNEWSARRRDLYWQYTTHTTDKLACSCWDWNPRSQQASGCKPRPLGPAQSHGYP